MNNSKPYIPNLSSRLNDIDMSAYTSSKTVKKFTASQFIEALTPNKSYFVTLTFRHKTKVETANKSLDKFHARLNREIYGQNRSTRKNNPACTSFVAITEYGSNSTLHFHLILHPITFHKDVKQIHKEALIEREDKASLLGAIKTAWNAVGGSTQQIDLRDIHFKEGASGYLVKEIGNDAWDINLNYCDKQISPNASFKADQSYIDWIKFGSKVNLV